MPRGGDLFHRISRVGIPACTGPAPVHARLSLGLGPLVAQIGFAAGRRNIEELLPKTGSLGVDKSL